MLVDEDTNSPDNCLGSFYIDVFPDEEFPPCRKWTECVCQQMHFEVQKWQPLLFEGWYTLENKTSISISCNCMQNDETEFCVWRSALVVWNLNFSNCEFWLISGLAPVFQISKICLCVDCGLIRFRFRGPNFRVEKSWTLHNPPITVSRVSFNLYKYMSQVMCT